MGYCSGFLRVMPHLEGGSLRVPNPFATSVAPQAELWTFDLHALSTLPAFVLSQDQTLSKKGINFIV